MNYFRFEIPTNADGSRVTYSKGWHGTMPDCPKDVTVLLYNDKEGYGIAKTNDAIVQTEIGKLTEKEVKGIITNTKDEDGVYLGVKLLTRSYDGK